MPIYEFECQCGYVQEVSASFENAPKLGAPRPCPDCKGTAYRTMSTSFSMCVQGDPDEIPLKDRVCPNPYGLSKSQARKREERYAKDIETKRKQAKEAQHSARKPGFRMTHSIPPEFYKGKIKQTGDKNYWKDPKNRDKHKGFKIQ